MNEILIEDERSELLRHENTIEQGLKTFVDVGNALLSIRDKRLYRQDFGTFEDYCQDRWGFTNEYARLHMRAAEVVKNIQKTPTIVGVLPATESQARPLTRLEPDMQATAWQRAVETAPNGKVTAAHVEATAKTFLPPNATPLRLQPIPANGARNFVAPYSPSESETARYVPPVATDEYEEMAEEDNTEVANGTKANGMSVHFSSKSPEHYTPQEIIDATVAVMDAIDLDPCSNSKDTPNIPALDHYTAEDDGLSLSWFGRVYMNPPYGRGANGIAAWVTKLASEYEQGNVTEAIALVPGRIDTQWWQTLRSYPACFVTGRLTFIGNEDSAPFPSVVFYLGENSKRFYEVFSELGDIWIRVDEHWFTD